MRDLTHYFQIPDKKLSPIVDNSRSPETQILKVRNESENSFVKQRKTYERKRPDTPCVKSNENSSKEKSESGKKRKETVTSRGKRSKKLKLDSSEGEDVSDELKVVVDSKKKADVHANVEKDVKHKNRKKYSRKSSRLNDTARKYQSNTHHSDDSDVDSKKENKEENDGSTTLTLNAVLLEDCMKSRGNCVTRSEENSTEVEKNKVTSENEFDSQESEGESLFVSTKKKSKVTKKDISPSNTNSLFNYFNKVPKSEYKDSPKKHPINVIKVQAIIHSPPKERIRQKQEKRVVIESEPVLKESRQLRNRKKVCIDKIEVISEDIIQPENFKVKNTRVQATDAADESLPFKSPSKDLKTPLKSQTWKMRVKITPSPKFDESIKTKRQRTRSEDKKDSADSPEDSDDEVQIVSVTEQMPELKRAGMSLKEEKKTVKLAALFCKKYDKSSNKRKNFAINEEARRLFLESGVPDTIKKKMEEQKTVVEEEYNGEYVFPKHTHVQQKDPSEFIWKLKEPVLNLKNTDDDRSLIQNILAGEFSFKNVTDNSKSTEDNGEQQKFDIKNEMAILKKQEPNVNVGDIHSSIKRLNKVSKNVSSDVCWTDKYNPAIFQDMVGNSNNLSRLKEWIESHKKIRIKGAGDESSSDEFIQSDDSYSSESPRNNIAILVGPPGSGKTSAVYMIANELGFKVLEVNAGSNRNGKRILDELLEATQSHRVKRTSFDQDVKKKKKKKENKNHKKDKKTMSLILMEDVDILFENCDDGFLSALNSLAAQSKRPLIFTANNLNYPHLLKYTKSHNLTLKFSYPLRPTINVWLQLIALFEGVKLTDEMLLYLFNVAGSDLRKNLLQLQTIISSKQCFPEFTKEQLFHKNWWSNLSLPRKKDFATKVKKRIEIENSDEYSKMFWDEENVVPKNDETLEVNSSVDVAENQSTMEKMENIKNLFLCANMLNTETLLSSFESNLMQAEKNFPTMNECSPQSDNQSFSLLGADISAFLKDTTFNGIQQKMSEFSFKKYYKFLREDSVIKKTNENVFTCFSSKINTSEAKYCDFMPAIRDIARIEKSKASNNVKRSNRYFSYLKSVNIDLSDKDIDLLCKSLL